uniref:(northern house mosquito) hypothetical protein n=1 Tax=Culex pipiens TaxID=7175 RepID=A0A8D8PG59_CULPI
MAFVKGIRCPDEGSTIEADTGTLTCCCGGPCIRGFHRHSAQDYVRGRAEYGLVSRQEKNARHNLMLKGFRSAVTDLAGEVTTPVDLVDVVIVDWATLTDDLTQLVVERGGHVLGSVRNKIVTRVAIVLMNHRDRSVANPQHLH